MMRKNKPGLDEQRHYIRLDSVVPVVFRLVSSDGKSFLSDWVQGFTRNIGKGGICLEVNHLNTGLDELVKNRGVKFSLKIEIPVITEPVTAMARVSWVNDALEGRTKYIVGLHYETIDPRYNNKIVCYARAKKLFVPFVSAVVIMLGAGFIADRYVNMQLVRSNRAIVAQLVGILRESHIARGKMRAIGEEKEVLQSKIQTLELRIAEAEKERALLGEEAQLERSKAAHTAEEFNTQVGKLTREKIDLQNKLAVLARKENTVTGELSRLGKRKATLEKANFDKMYRWLVIHQNPRTGLVMSFEGDNVISDWAFIYDQSLVAQAYMLSADYERAKKVLEFFLKKAKRNSGTLFYNSYYVHDGSPAEFIVHSGPNIWLGIAALHYTEKTKEKACLRLAEEIASGILNLQSQDTEGGIKGGPDVAWYSTEHNLDAYAFFDMLYRVTAQKQYMAARDKILHWLLLHTYDKTDVPIKRGKGDSTIATDTYAWSIAAVGPEKLEELGMDPDRILEFAEQNCAVEVEYTRPEGQAVKIRGFDFAPQRHVSRGGVVSPEWTAQMVISFKKMAEFYYKKNLPAKAGNYESKADAYLASLGNMIISSPSPSGQGESCLPYASQQNVDTGHGWLTPGGKSTGSVAGTAYTFFAHYNYNPLEFKE
jgi:F0F1-type ATP synthase assembly protein I